MTGENYYILTALPSLGELGSAAPISPAKLLEFVGENRPAERLLQVVFLSDDLFMHQAYMAGEIKDISPAVLTIAQTQNEEPLPDYLTVTQKEIPRQVPVDDLWEVYFRYASKVAGDVGSEFLLSWLAYEVTLRNALAAARAKALNLDANDYVLATELARDEENFSVLINEWAAASTPWAGEQVLDKGRWDWLVEHEGWFTFADDELAAYAAKLILLRRWERMAKAEQNAAQENARSNLNA